MLLSFSTHIFFVCFYSSNNFALQAKRKTLAASDVLSALSDMEFEEFTPELKSFLEGGYCMMHTAALLTTDPEN